MAFENLTLFEISLDDAQFGPRSLGRGSGGGDDGAEPGDTESAATRGRLASLAVLALVTVGAALYWRRASGVDVPPEDAESKLADAQ